MVRKKGSNTGKTAIITSSPYKLELENCLNSRTLVETDKIKKQLKKKEKIKEKLNLKNTKVTKRAKKKQEEIN